VTIDRNYENNSIEISQRRYLLDLHRSRDDTNHCYFVPLSFTTKKEQNFTATHAREWLECDCRNGEPTKTIANLAAEDEWVIVNLKLGGLYKVKYDSKNWNLLVDELNSPNFKIIETINRAQLINDALDFAWSGEQDYDIALSVINYLQQEDEYLPWKAALDGLADVNRILQKTPMYELFRDYMKLILEPIYEKLGGLDMDQKSSNKRLDYVKHKVMIAAWSCRFDVGDCVDRSVKMFKEWMEEKDPDTNNPIPVDLRRVVYCNAVRQGRDREWNFLWRQYKKSNVASEKNMIISSLACARQQWILTRYLDWSLNTTSGVRKQDAYMVFGGIVKNEAGFDIAKTFFFDRINEIYSFLEPETSRLTRYIKPLAENMASQKELNDLRSLVEEKASLFEKASQGVKQALEKVEINQQWKHANYQPIAIQLSRTLHAARTEKQNE